MRPPGAAHHSKSKNLRCTRRSRRTQRRGQITVRQPDTASKYLPSLQPRLLGRRPGLRLSRRAHMRHKNHPCVRKLTIVYDFSRDLRRNGGALVVAFAYGFEQRLSELDDFAVTVEHVHAESRI